MEYSQFCPIAKASEVLGEKWTILIVRELLMGARRFNELQRGLSLISPTILTKRLQSLVDYGLIVKKKIAGQQGYEYFPTEACKELLPVLKALGDWGMRWTQSHLTESDYDVELLMLYLQRSVCLDKLIGDETVIYFKFTDIANLPDWWLIARNQSIDVCVKDPGKEVDVYLTCQVKTMVDVWMGNLTYRQAISNNMLKVVGPGWMTKNIFSWMNASIFSGLPSADHI